MAAGHFFVVRRQEVELLARVRHGVVLQVRGRLERVGRVRATVRHEVRCGGVLVARALVFGVWFGPGGSLGRIPPVTRAFDDPTAEWPALEVEPVGTPEISVPVRIRRSDCDMLGHVNATTYLELFEDARQLGGAGDPGEPEPLRAARISYDGETFAGDEVVIEGASQDGGWRMAMRRGDDVCCRAWLGV